MSEETIQRAKRIMAEDLADMLAETSSVSSNVFDALAAQCESPIEVLMLGALAFGLSRSIDAEQYPAPAFASRPSGMTGLWVMPQFPMGDYRVDFLVVHVSEPAPKLFTRARIVVECDGHAFHEKTPEQAERDKSRDRAILAMGFPVARFTGREIVRDPRACADSVAAALAAEANRQLKAMIDATEDAEAPVG